MCGPKLQSLEPAAEYAAIVRGSHLYISSPTASQNRLRLHVRIQCSLMQTLGSPTPKGCLTLPSCCRASLNSHWPRAQFERTFSCRSRHLSAPSTWKVCLRSDWRCVKSCEGGECRGHGRRISHEGLRRRTGHLFDHEGTWAARGSVPNDCCSAVQQH